MATIAQLPTRAVTSTAKMLGIVHAGAYRQKTGVKLYAARVKMKCKCCGTQLTLYGPEMKKQIAQLRRVFKGYKVVLHRNFMGVHSIYVRER